MTKITTSDGASMNQAAAKRNGRGEVFSRGPRQVAMNTFLSSV